MHRAGVYVILYMWVANVVLDQRLIARPLNLGRRGHVTRHPAYSNLG